MDDHFGFGPLMFSLMIAVLVVWLPLLVVGIVARWLVLNNG